ncbi:hypothetical protein RJ639_023148 [Escallonia herrerae]|uniref:Malectin-like domain-containing protein n=1 Tax=Escallonia herrerae TaxID=1293975 RepID=A0AA89AEN2_9ASTE|nr:hypothetical protein RJ639_023148 [Escallonia herrerae]
MITLWESKEVSTYLNIHKAGSIPSGEMFSVNFPPWAAAAYAIQAENLSSFMYSSVDFLHQTPVQAYSLFYFMDPIYRRYSNQTSRAEIYIDKSSMAVVDVPQCCKMIDSCLVVSLFPVPVVGSANVTISPADLGLGVASPLICHGSIYRNCCIEGGYSDGDRYNRIWEPAIPSGLVERMTDTRAVFFTPYEDPPYSAIWYAVEANGSANSILLSFNIGKTNSLNYIEAYFTEIRELETNETRQFDVYVNNGFAITGSPEYQNCTGIVVTASQAGTLTTVELRPTPDSTLPPIISAIEVYTASDPLVTTGTSQDDISGLAVFISTFAQLDGWSGEPCLPSYTAWQWLGCSAGDPVRVLSL